MFTTEFIQNLANLNKKKEDAEQLLYFMRQLNITNDKILSKANSYIKSANDEESKAINYIISFLPEEFIQEIGLIRAWGCFCTEVCGVPTLFTEVNLITEKYNEIHLTFDNEQKCLYSDFLDRREVVNKYFRYNNQFIARIT